MVPCSPTMMSKVFEVGLELMQWDAVRMCRELIKVPPQNGLLPLFCTNATCHGREYGEAGAPPTICPVTNSRDEGGTPQAIKQRNALYISIFTQYLFKHIS